MSRTYITDLQVNMSHVPQYDCVIIGSGAAGLMTALTLHEDKRILILTKTQPEDSNSALAQGGIAAALSEEDIDLHIADTMIAGCNFNDEKAVGDMIKRSSEAIDVLLQYGVPFDRDEDNDLLVTREGGHSARRVLHYKDMTGKAITDSLLEALQTKDNITLLSDACVSDIVTDQHKAVGVSYFRGGKQHVVAGNCIVLATGGIGGLFKATTNTTTLTGDGMAMAIRAGASVKDLEFIQFHPTAYSTSGVTFLISEAVRGEGGVLINDQGQRFMKGIHPMAELAPRNIVAKAIFDQMQDGQTVYLDVRHLGPYFKERFPTIYGNCMAQGVDPLDTPVPIQPVQHYVMGGIQTDPVGRTAVDRLYACGEAAWTGVHGANRLASNSLLEAVVYGKSVAEDINQRNLSAHLPIIHSQRNGRELVGSEDVRQAVQAILSQSAFIVRNRDQILKGIEALANIKIELESQTATKAEEVEIFNMVLVADRILQAALVRETSLGSHIRTDEGE